MNAPTKQEIEDQKSIEELLNSLGETEERADAIVGSSLLLSPDADGVKSIPIQQGTPAGDSSSPPNPIRRTPKRKATVKSSTPAQEAPASTVAPTAGESGAELMVLFSKKATRGEYNRRLELFGSPSVQAKVDALITDVYAATGVRLYYTRIAAYAIEKWLAEDTLTLTDVPDLSGQANLSAKIPETMKVAFLKRIYAIDRKVPYSHVALHAINTTLDELRALFVDDNRSG